ncbi:STOP protein-domain-containing protein [Blastocladiella britannica]|nr:STOP protein-domain-containing protein [Blastocladiella britannica]
MAEKASSSSPPSSMAEKSGSTHQHSPACICQLCDCGKHRCGRPAISGGPMDGVTEYKDRFPTHPVIFTGQRKPPPHVATSTAAMASVTENRDQYGLKTIPAKFQLPKRVYNPTAAPLESNTGYMADFKAWKIPPRESAKPPEVYRASGDFDGLTTNKNDFQSWQIPERYRHPKQKYVPNPSPLESKSSYAQDYAPLPVSRHIPRPPEAYAAVQEDRGFATTMQSAYVGFTGSRPQRRIQQYVPSGTTFEGQSTSAADYANPGRPEKRDSCKPPHASVDAGAFDGASEYNAVFTRKPVNPPPKRAPAAYVPNPAPLDGLSTMKTDFVGAYAPRRADFGPKLAYAPERDDRSWVTETKDMHGKKDVPLCSAVDHKNNIGASMRKERDGHIYLVPGSPAAAAAAGPRSTRGPGM